MNILGIETSCDETAAAVVRNGHRVLSNVVATSLKDHQKYGGIIPEIASRRQLEFINTVVRRALHEASLSLNDMDAISVTQEPGLIGSLLVGISYARALSLAGGQPLVQVDHIQAHLYSNFLRMSQDTTHQGPLPELPAVGLIVSGGHTNLYLIRDFKKFQLLGQTRDDAAGEAFDKVARVLGLGYPGGPAIQKAAQTARKTNLRFRCAEIPNSFDFSFSGIKTAVLYNIQNQTQKNIPAAEIAHAFQESVVDVLVRRSLEACRKRRVRTLLVGGGVAANELLRERLTSEGKKLDVKVFVPPLPLCIDNAAMVAGLAYQKIISAKRVKG